MPSDAELSTMEAFCRVMKPLVSITEAIGAEKWVTISSVRPLLHKLLNSYLKTQAEDNEQEKMMKKAMRDKLSCRYTGSILMMLNIAAFLDPRFRLLSCLSEEERNDVLEAVEDEVLLINAVSDSPDPSLEEPVSKRSKGEDKLFNLFDDLVQPICQDPMGKGKAEVRRYAAEEPVNELPLEWWKVNCTRFPMLSSVAKNTWQSLQHLCLPKEPLVSAGHIVNCKRGCLLPESVNMLVFLAENL